MIVSFSLLLWSPLAERFVGYEIGGDYLVARSALVIAVAPIPRVAPVMNHTLLIHVSLLHGLERLFADNW